MQNSSVPIDPVVDEALERVLEDLRLAREAWRSARSRHAEFGALGFPSRHAVGRLIDVLAAALFPLRLGPAEVNAANDLYKTIMSTELSQDAATQQAVARIAAALAGGGVAASAKAA